MTDTALPVIAAVVVNHNTSLFTELLLRSLFATHPNLPNLHLTVLDNASTDDTAALFDYAQKRGVTVRQSGFTTATRNNSHGEALANFVRQQPDCDYYLFLDSDVVFVQPDTIASLLRELQAAPDAFGAGPQMSWDGITPYAEEAVNANPDVYTARLHPCCALIANTALFRRVVDAVGLQCANLLWAERDEYLDTFKLMTRVMQTHGLRHIITNQIVIHFFSVSYEWDTPEFRQSKLAHRDRLLAELRDREHDVNL